MDKDNRGWGGLNVEGREGQGRGEELGGEGATVTEQK